MKHARLLCMVMTVLLLFGATMTTEAALNAVKPGPYGRATGFFPLWYQDTNGIGLRLCLSNTPSPNPEALGAPLCNLLPSPGFDPDLPIAFPGNFPDETFWFTADARVRGATFDVSLIISLEAAFATGAVINGDQVSFARVRLVGTVDTPGVYTITHPYGVEVIDVQETGSKAIKYTRDIGIGAPGDFSGALAGDIGPFLVRTNAKGLVAPITVGTETFIGDPNVDQTVTGSPLGTNFLRIQGPGGIDSQSNLFKISGKVFKGPALPTPLIVDRASYSRTVNGTSMDVFATAPTTAIMSGADSAALAFPMAGDSAGRFFGQAIVPPAVLGPVTLSASSRPFNKPAFPANAAVTQSSTVSDLVIIKRAIYSRGLQKLVISASSSDVLSPPTLSYGQIMLKMTAIPPQQRVTVNGLAIPPATVTVTSSAGGSDTAQVEILP